MECILTRDEKSFYCNDLSKPSETINYPIMYKDQKFVPMESMGDILQLDDFHFLSTEYPAKAFESYNTFLRMYRFDPDKQSFAIVQEYDLKNEFHRFLYSSKMNFSIVGLTMDKIFDPYSEEISYRLLFVRDFGNIYYANVKKDLSIEFNTNKSSFGVEDSKGATSNVGCPFCTELPLTFD
ncbi:MAG: hypothetical protein R3A11_00560 [Bdellovibrionota bacterium]